MRKSLILSVVVVSIATSVARADGDFYIRATAEFDGGVKKEFVCERKAGESKKEMFETNMPMAGNKVRSYSFQCVKGTEFFGLSFRIKSVENMVTAEFKPFDGSKVIGDVATPVFTMKVKAGDKVMDIHSFKGQEHHYKAAGTRLKITEFSEVEDADLRKFHVIAGEGTAEFEKKRIKNNLYQAGKVTFSFKVRPEYKPSPI